MPVAPVISAAGFTTTTGGGALSAAARAAMDAAAGATWRVADLQLWAGDSIAGATGAEAGLVTSGAGAAIAVGAAACLHGRAPGRRRLIVQRGHRNAYDHLLELAGAEIVDVGFPQNAGVGTTYARDLADAIDERTAAVYHLVAAEQLGLGLREVCAVARAHAVPVIVDAAAELPPSSNLRRFIDDGADLVAFSGGKALRGPQASGILAGRDELIARARISTSDMDVDATEWRAATGEDPPHQGFGRGFKVGKEEIAALVGALEEFVTRDHEAERDELDRWLGQLADSLAAGSARATVVRDAHFYPRLTIVSNPARARNWARGLAQDDPAIIVPHHGLDRGELAICPEAVPRAQRDVVAQRLVTILGNH